MPSIFVWKAKQPISNCTTIQYYSGANWFLEEHSSYSKSAIYLHQQALSNNGWMFDIKWMPNNWVGSHLLENKLLPYSLIKDDHYARLEQIGDWMRATTIQDIPHESREKEWSTIQQWSLVPQQAIVTQHTTYPKEAIYKLQSPVSTKHDEPCLINLSYGSYTNTRHSRHVLHKSYERQPEAFYKKSKII